MKPEPQPQRPQPTPWYARPSAALSAEEVDLYDRVMASDRLPKPGGIFPLPR